MSFIGQLLYGADHTPIDDPRVQNVIRPQPVDTRSPFERIRDNYDLLHQKYSDRRTQLERQLEQMKTDLSECEAIILSLEAGRQALNNQIVERGLLGNDSIIRGIEEQKD